MRVTHVITRLIVGGAQENTIATVLGLHARPGVTVDLAFLEFMEPPLADAVEKLALAGHTSITIAPLFMAQGGHLKNDLPKILDAIRAEHRGAEITLLPAIGDVDAILDAIAGWLVGATAG